MSISSKELFEWCQAPYQELEGHPDLKIPFRLVKDSESMGRLMARELVDEIQAAASRDESFRGIIPCGPSCPASS